MKQKFSFSFGNSYRILFASIFVLYQTLALLELEVLVELDLAFLHEINESVIFDCPTEELALDNTFCMSLVRRSYRGMIILMMY